MGDLVDIFGKVIGVYSLLIIFFGTIGNLFCFYICLRKNLRTIPTFVFYSFMLLSDILSLYFWNLDHYLLFFNSYFIENFSLRMCSFVTFLQFFSLHYSAWLLVLLVLERLLAIKLKSWRNYFKPKRCVLAAVLIAVVIIGINLIFLVQLTKEQYVTDGLDSNLSCFNTVSYSRWSQSHGVLECVFPFTIILVANILLVHCLVKDEKRIHASEDRKSRRKSTTVTVIITTTIFILTKAPSAIVSAFFLDAVLQTRFGFIFLSITDCISFTDCTLNLLILKWTNKKFSEELSIMCKAIRKRN